MEIECDLASIRDEDLLRKMWQQSEDFGRKKEIRSHLYKLRESRLREFYSTGGPGGEIMNPSTDLHYGKTPLTPSHGDSLVDQSFQSLKSKEIRDSLSPTHEVKFRNSGGVAGGVLVPDTTGWDVQTSSEVSPDGRAFRTETLAKTDGVEKLPGGHAEFAGRNEQKSSASHQGDDKNYVKKAAESSKTHLQEKVVIGDENSGRTEMKSSSVTSSSKVTSSSSQQVFSSDDPGFDMEPRRLTQHQHQDQRYQNRLQAANNSSSVHSERQQFSRNERNERNERQETTSNVHEENKKYVDMDKASPEYQQHVQYLMSQPGAIVSNTVEYPKPGVKMITTVKKLPDGTTVKTKRYETEASAAGADSTTQSTKQQQQQQQQRTTSSTSTTSQKITDKRIQDSEDVFTRLARTRDSNLPAAASPRNAPESPSSTENINSRLRNVNDHKFSDSIDQRSTQILRDTNQQHPGSRNAPIRRPSDLVENVEVISTTNKHTIKKDLNQSVRSENITSSDFIQNERDRYVLDQDSPSRRRGPDGYPEALAPITPAGGRHGRPSQPDDYPSNGYNATEVVKQSSTSNSSAKFSESRRYSTETVESYQHDDHENQDHTTRGYPSNRRPIDEPNSRSPSSGRPGGDFSTHGFPSVRSDKPTQQSPSDRSRPHDDYNSTERVHIIHTDRSRPGDANHPESSTTTRSNYSTNETRRHVTSTKEDFSTHGFPSVRAGTPTRDSPRRPLGYEPSPGDSPRRPSGQEPPAHQARRPPSDGYSTHGFPSVKSGSPTEDSPRRPSGPEPTNQGRRPTTTDDYSTHGFPSVKPAAGRSTPTQSSPRYDSPTRFDRDDTSSVRSEDTSNSVVYEKKIDAAHQAFARSLRCASPVESVRRDSTSDRHTPRSSIGSVRNSYSPSSKRDGRSPSHDSVTNSESSRISSATVTKTQRPTEVRRVSHPKSPIGKSAPSHVSNDTIDLTLTRKITAKPSPDKPATGRPTPIKEEPIVAEPILRKKIFGATENFLASEGVIEKPILKKQQYYQLGLSDATLPSSHSKARQELGSTPNTSRRVHNTEEELNTLLDTTNKHITTHPSSTTPTTTRSSKTKDPKPITPETLYSKKPITTPEGYITLNQANEISEKHNQTTNKHVSYPHYIPSGPKADRSPSDRPTTTATNNLSSPAPITTTSTTSHNAPKSTKDNVKPSTTTTSPTTKPFTSPSKVDNSTSSRFTKTVKNAINRDTTTTTRRPELEPESKLDTDSLPEPEDLDEGYVPDRKGKRKPNSKRPTSDDEGFEPDSPRAGSPTSDFEYRRPEQVETYDEEDSLRTKKTSRTDKKVVTNDFLNTERNVTKPGRPQEGSPYPVDQPKRRPKDRDAEKPEGPKRPEQDDGRKPSKAIEKPSGPKDRSQPEDQEPKRPQRHPEQDGGRKPSNSVEKPTGPKDRSQPEDQEPRRPQRRPEQDDGRKPSKAVEKPSGPKDRSQPEDQEPKRPQRHPEQDGGRKPSNSVEKPTGPKDRSQPEDQEPRRPQRRPEQDDGRKPSKAVEKPSGPKDRSQPEDQEPKRPQRHPEQDGGRKPSNSVEKPTGPKDRSQPEDQEPKRPQRRPNDDEDTELISYPKDRKPSQLIDEPTSRTGPGNEPEEPNRRPSYQKEPIRSDDKPSRPSETSSRPRGTKPPLERSETFEERCRQILGMDSETIIDQTTKIEEFIDTERTTVDWKRRPSDRSPSPKKKQPSDTVSIEDCGDDDLPNRPKYPSKTTTTTTTVKTSREHPRDKSPHKNGPYSRPIDENQSPDGKLPKRTTTNEYDETTATVSSTKITDDRSPSPKRKSPKDFKPSGDDNTRPRGRSPSERGPRDRSPSDRSGRIDETTTIREATKIVDEIDERSTRSKPGSRSRDQSPQEKSPIFGRPSSLHKKQPSDTVSIEDCEDDDDSGSSRKPSTNKTTTTVKTTRGHPRDKSPVEKRPNSRPSDQLPVGRLPNETTTNEYDETTTTITTSKVTDDRSPSPKRKSPKEINPVEADDIRPRGRSPADKPKRVDETTTFTKTSRIVDEIDEQTTRSKPGSYPKDQSPKDQSPRETRPRGTSPTDDSDIDSRLPSTTRPRNRSPSEKITLTTTRETTFDVETSSGKSPFKQPVRETSPTYDSPSGKSPFRQPVRGSSPTGESPHGKSPFRQPASPTDESPRGKSPFKQPVRDSTPTGEAPAGKSPLRRPASPTDESPRGKSPLKKPVRETSPTDEGENYPNRPVLERRPTDNSPRDMCPTSKPTRGKSPTEETIISTTTTIHSTDGVVEDRYPSYTPKSYPRDRSPLDKQKPKAQTTEEEEVLIETSKKTKKTSTEEIHDDVFEINRPRGRQPDTRDGSFLSQPRDQSPSEPGVYRTRTDEIPRDRSPEKPRTKETEESVTKKATKTTEDTTIESEFTPSPRPSDYRSDYPRDRSPNKKPTTEETEEYRRTSKTSRDITRDTEVTERTPSSRPKTYPRDQSPVDDLTRPTKKGITETRRVDKTTVINEFLDTERGVDRSQRPKEDKPFDSKSPERLTSSHPRDYLKKEVPTKKPKGPKTTEIDESTIRKTTKDTTIENVEELFPSSRPRDRSPTEKPIRSPRIVTTDTTTEYGISSRPRSESPSDKPRKPVDSEEIDETYIRKTTKITEDATITTDLHDDDVGKPSRRPRPTGTKDKPREKSPQKPKQNDRSPSPRSKYPLDQGTRAEGKRPQSRSLIGKQPRTTDGSPRRTSSPEKPRIYNSTDEETNLVKKTKTTKITTTSRDEEDVDFEDRPRDRSPSEKPRPTNGNQSPRERLRGTSPTKKTEDREPTDSDYEETVVKRTDKRTRNETTFEETTDLSPRNYPVDKPRENFPTSKPSGRRPTEETEDRPRGTSPSEKPRPRDRSPIEKPRKPTEKTEDRPRGTSPSEKPRPRDRSPSEKPRKPMSDEETIVQTTSIKTTTIEDRFPKAPRETSPLQKPELRDYPRDRSPTDGKPRKPENFDETYVERTTTETTTVKDRLPKSPRRTSPSEKPGPRDYPRDKSPTEKPRKTRLYDENIVEQTTTESNTVKDRLPKSPRGTSPSEKPSPRDYPRDRSPTEKPRKTRLYDENVVEQTTTESTAVKDRLPKSPRGTSPSEKLGPRDYPRDRSPTEKPRKTRLYDENVAEQTTTEPTSVKDRFPKSPRGTSPSEKPGPRDYPRDRSPTEKPRKTRLYEENFVEKTTTGSTTVKDRLTKSPRGTSPSEKPGSRDNPRDRSPTDKSRKPRPSNETITQSSIRVTNRTITDDQPRPRGSSPTEKPGRRQPIEEKPEETFVGRTTRNRKTLEETTDECVEDCCAEQHPRDKSPLRKPKGSKPVGETVVKRTTKTTTVDDRLTKTPRGSSPTKTSPRERSPTQKPGYDRSPKDSPRRLSPSEKPSRRQPIVSEVGRNVQKITSKFSKDIKASEKIIVKDQPRRKSPSEKPRRLQPTEDEDTDDETTETIIAVYTIDGETVESQPRDLSPKRYSRKPSEDSPKRPQTNGHSDHPRGISPTNKPGRRQPTDEEIEESFISTTSRITKVRETGIYPEEEPKRTRGQPRELSPVGKPRGRQPTDESIDITVVRKTSKTLKDETSLEETEYQYTEDRPRDRSPKESPSFRAYPRDSSPKKPTDEDIDETVSPIWPRKTPIDDDKSPLQKSKGPTAEETILYTTKVTTKIEDHPRDRSPSDKPGTRSYPRDRSPTDRPTPKSYPSDKSPLDKSSRPRPSKLEETTNRSTTVRKTVQETDFEKRYPKSRPGDQSPGEKPSTLRRPSKLSTTTTTATTRNRSTLDEQDINKTTPRSRTQPSTRDKVPTKTTPLSSPRAQPTTERRIPAELPSPVRKPKSTFGVTTKTTTSTVTRSTGASRPKPVTETPKKPSKLPLESRPSARPVERKPSPSISPDSSPSRPGSDFEIDSPYRSPNMSPSRKSPSPTRSVKLEDITSPVNTTKKTTVSTDTSKPKVTHVTTAKFQITPPTSPNKVISSPEMKFSPSPKKPSSRVPTPKPSKLTTETTSTTKKVTSKVYKDGFIPTDSERDSEVPTDAEEIDSPLQQKPSTRKLPVTERKESAPVHRVTKINKDIQMARSTSENIIKTPITKRPSRHEPLEPQSEVPSSRPTLGDRSSPKTERRPSKHLSTKTINLTTFDKLINSEDMENVVIDIQHAKSSREPSPNKIVPTPVSVDVYTGKPRYPDVVQEPEDEPKKKPNVKNIPIFEEETNDFVGCQITEVSEETHENTLRARTTIFIEKESSPQRQAPRIVTGDNVDSECLLSVHDKVSKFISTAEEVSKPKTSAPFRRDVPEKDMPEDDECLLTVDEKVSKFLKTADSVTKEIITSKPRRVERPSIEDIDEDLKTDECVLSVSEKVNKFTTKAEKLAPSAPQRSPELVARIERQISRQSDVESESPECDDSPASVRKFKPTSPLTERTERKYTERQIDILSRPSVWEKKPKPDVKLDDIIGSKPEDTPRKETQTKPCPDDGKSKPVKQIDSVSKRKELFENKVSTNKTTTTTKPSSPEKHPSRPSKSPSERRPSDDSDSRYPNEFIPQYVDGYSHQGPDDDVHEDVYGSSKTRRVYETSSRETSTIHRSPERSPTRKPSHPESRPTTQTTNKSPRQQPEDKTPSRRYSEDHSPRYPTRDQPSTDRYMETREASEHTTRRRSSTQEYPERRSPYNGSPSPLRKQPPVEEPEDYTFSSRRDEKTTHHTTRTAPRSPKDSPLTPTSFLDDEDHDHSPARSTSTVSSHKQVTTHRTTSKRLTEDSTSRRPRRPSGNESTTPTSGNRTPRSRAVPETVAVRRNIFEKSPGDISPMPTNRRPSYMEPTRSYLEHRKDSLEITKTNFSRKSSVEEEPYEPSPRTSVKFGVGLKHKEEPKPKRKLSSSDIPNIEDVFELELLEEMLNIVTLYEQRRRIRAQIRVVKKLLETKTKEEVSKMTKISTIRKTSSSSVRESPTPRRETPMRPERYQPIDDDIDSESIIESHHHVEEHEEIIRERSISPQAKTSRIVTKVTEVRKIGDPSTPNKRTPLKTKDEPKESKPIWATKNILKKPSENEKVTRALTAKKTTSSTSSSSMSRTQQQTHRQRVSTDDDCVTSSYGIGPTDEDGRPLFGIRALKKKATTTNNSVQPSETTKVTGTVITEKYYSENGAEPVGERKVTVYSTNPEDLVDLEIQYDRRDSETVKREKLSKDGVTTVTKVQKIGKYKPGEIPSLTDDAEFTKASSKMVRRGSVKEMSEKFIRKESSSSVTEKSSSGYPKAGLILRTRTNSGATADTADQYEVRGKSTEYDYDSEDDVEIRTSRKHSKVVTESEDETEIRRKVNTRSFLNSGGSKVTGVDDVLDRMRNADNVVVDGDTLEDREARSLLNKFLGASVLMSGMESMIPQMELRKSTAGADNKQEVKTTRVTKTIKTGSTTGGSSSSPVTRETCDFEEIWDEETLKQLLEKSTSYEERRSIRARLRQLMADREGQSTTTTQKTETKKEDGGVVTTTTKVTTRTITGAPKPVSPFAKFQQLDKQNSLQSPKSPLTPTTPGGSSSTPIFKFTDPALNARAATFKEQLLQWCQSKTQEYENVQITNFSASWTDGLAFCALIHHFLPDAFDYSKLNPKQRRYNFELAFRVADEKAGIAPLLDVEDMVVMKRPDWKCVFTYVQSIYRRFRNCQ